MGNLRKADWSDPERVQQLVQSYSERYGSPFWNRFIELLGEWRPSSVLEFGCGPGLFLADAVKRLGATRVYGIDTSPEMLQQAKTFLSEVLDESRFQLIRYDLDGGALTLEKEVADLAFSGFFLHEVDNPQAHISDSEAYLQAHGIYTVYDFVSGNEEAFVSAMTVRGMSEEKARKRYPHMCRHSVKMIEWFFTDAGFHRAKSIMVNDFIAIVLGFKG